MSLLEAYRKLQQSGLPVITTREAAGYLQLPRAHASKILSRLVDSKHVHHLARGKWSIVENVDPLILPEHITAPWPSYISLQTALYHHGILSQLPEIIYAVSLSRSRSLNTTQGAISIHHISKSFFFGFTSIGRFGAKMAVPEKAILDILYLSASKNGLFRSLLELEIPRSFSKDLAYKMISRITSKRRQVLVLRKFEELLSRS